MGCVNTSSKEFKALASRHNLDSDTLELIVHKYWIQTGNETLFPTDVYIQAQMGNVQYQESVKNVRKLWEKRYSHPMEYPTLKALNGAIREAERYFPGNAINYYKNAKGNFVLSIKRPVAKVRHNKEAFFKEYDNASSTKDIKTLDLNITEGKSYGIDKVQELFDKFNIDRTSKDLANRVFSLAKDLGLNIVFDESLEGSLGRYTNNNSIRYKKSFFERDLMNDKKASILLHEVLHAVSSYALSDQTANWKRPEALETFRTEINSLYQDLKNNPILKGERGITDLHEFVAELANPIFRAKIQNIDRENNAAKRIEKKSFWSRVIDAFKNLLGLHVTNSYYERSMNALDKALNAFDIDTYMRYNGIKNQLRQGYNAKEWEFNSMTDKEVKDKVGNYFDSQVYDEELLSLKKKAIADGTFMKAPNGKATNLNERQWLQVRTQAFKDWFGDWENDSENASKVVDENGEPLVVYHGSAAQFKAFDKSKNKKGYWEDKAGNHIDYDSNKTFFFSSNKAVAKSYSLLDKMTGSEISKSGINTINKYLEGINYITKLTPEDTIEKYQNIIADAIKDISTYRDTTIYKKLKAENINNTLALHNGKLMLVKNTLEGLVFSKLPSRFFQDAIGSIKTVLNKRIESYSKPRTAWDGTPIPVVNINEGVYSVFLNIRNPFAFDYKGVQINGKYKDKYPIKYINARQVKHAIEDGHDGVIYNNIADPYLANNYGVFNPNQIKSATDNNGEFSTTNNEIYNYELTSDYVKTLTGKQLKDELGIIKQESHDYNLVNGIEEEKKHSGKAVPQDFTFADGITIKAPFRPNAQQVDALNAMDEFLKSEETSMTLSGYAGTGKTSLMEMIAKKALKNGQWVEFCASTNKAAAVLKDKVAKAGFSARTVNSLFGIQVEANTKNEIYDAKDLVVKLRSAKIDYGTTVIIDEASMINKENYDILNQVAQQYGLKIIYVGDEAQLPPVKENQISKVFHNGNGKVIRLTQVERTDDNAILKEATDIRNGKPLSGESSFNSKGEGVAYIKPQHQKAINEILEEFVKGLKSNPNYFRVLAMHNAAVSEYNTKVRHLLGYDSPTPRVGEPMTGYANWGYNWKTKSYDFINSEAYEVVKAGKPTEVSFVIGEDREVLECIPLTLKDSLGNEQEFNYIDIKGNEQNKKVATALAKRKSHLWDIARASRYQNKEALKEINRIEKFLFVNDDIKTEGKDGKEYTLQNKVIDFGYAMTVHKSQGSTFTHVLMDDVDIVAGAKELEEGVNENNNSDLNDNTSPDLSTMQQGEEVPFDFDGDSTPIPSNTPTTAQPVNDPNHIDYRQALEYVAVSRATDTVTIISGNVKKEGSPLHPKNALKEEQPSKATEATKSTITQQVIDHLKNIPGINVLGRSAMEEFLKSHSLKYLQQFISKHNLPKGELPTLSSALMTKHGNNTSFGDVIQTANYEYTVNYKGAGEFDIIEYHKIDNNLEERIYDKERRRVPGTFDRLSTRDEITKRQYPSNSYNVKDGEANGNYAGLDKSTSQGESQQTEGNVSSNQHQEWSTIKRDSVTGRITFIDGDGRTIDSFEETKDLDFFTTPQGEVYGFVDKEGNIYLDETKISPNHPIHEYTHLWDRTVQKKNPKLWQKGIELMKKTSLWNEILNDENYGKQWQSMNLSQERLESLIASEVHARLVGENGEKLLENLAKQKGQEGIIGKLKQWILDMWKEVKATFGNWSQEDLDNLKLKDFNHMTVRDFLEGTNLKEASNATYNEDAKVETAQSMQEVSLPNYEKQMNLYTSLAVAQWKTSYLKELDAQINSETPNKKVTEILNQMDEILKATSEEEYKQSLEEAKKSKTEKILNSYDILNKQIDNLLSGEGFKKYRVKMGSTEIRHVAEMAVNDISDLITRLQTEKDLVKKIFPAINTTLDLRTLSRKEIVDLVGMSSLVEYARNMMMPKNARYNKLKVIYKSGIIVENWQAVMFLAQDYFALNEGFGMQIDYEKGIYTTTERPVVTIDTLLDVDSSSNSNDADVAQEEGKDDPEKYQIDMKTVDIINSMSDLVRQQLRQCYVLDENHNKVMNDWKRYDRVSVRDVTNSLLNWCQGTRNLEDMIKVLSEKQEHNPWVSQLITKLSDTSGDYSAFQSQFYGLFSKAFQNYCITKNDKGKWVTMPVNSHSVRTDAFNAIKGQYQAGEHPLFLASGRIDLSKIGTKEAVKDGDPFTLQKAQTKLWNIHNPLRSFDPNAKLTKEQAEEVTTLVTQCCATLGFPVPRDTVAEAVNMHNTAEWGRYLIYIIEDLQKADKLMSYGKLNDYNPFAYKAKHSIENAVKNFINPIADVLESTATQSFYNNGKMYQNYVAPSFLTKLMKNFHLKGEDFENFIREEYGSSEWFRDQNEKDLSKGWRCGLFNIIMSNDHFKDMIDHRIDLSFDDHGYMRKMTPQEYTINLVCQFISANSDILDDIAPAWFRVPMQSNKPSNDFICLPSFRNSSVAGTHYKDTITGHLYDIAKQEIMRIQTVNMRNLSKNDPGFITNYDTKGRQFNFLPVLNAYLNNSDIAKKQRTILHESTGEVSANNEKFAKLLQKKVKAEKELTSEEIIEFERLCKEVIKQSVEDKVQSMMKDWESQGLVDIIRDKVKNIYPKEYNQYSEEHKLKDMTSRTKEWIETFMWNDTLASKWILELTVTDLAFYKDADNLQKRLGTSTELCQPCCR